MGAAKLGRRLLAFMNHDFFPSTPPEPPPKLRPEPGGSADQRATDGLTEVELARALRPPVRRGFELTWQWLLAGTAGFAAFIWLLSSRGGAPVSEPPAATTTLTVARSERAMEGCLELARLTDPGRSMRAECERLIAVHGEDYFVRR